MRYETKDCTYKLRNGWCSDGECWGVRRNTAPNTCCKDCSERRCEHKCTEVENDTMYCPSCGKKTLEFIEQCESDEGVVKTSWACSCCSNIVYIYEFKQPGVATSNQ